MLFNFATDRVMPRAVDGYQKVPVSTDCHLMDLKFSEAFVVIGKGLIIFQAAEIGLEI